jgi:hypothetical protein
MGALRYLGLENNNLTGAHDLDFVRLSELHMTLLPRLC